MKKVYLQPLVEIVTAMPFTLCAGSKTADYDDLGEGGGKGKPIEVEPDDAARITWGNLWAEEEQDFYAYNAWE